ncbi:MAG: amidase [Chloroflexi bacterium]|nr:amidase [Chloroflexota bacterium]
MAADRDLAFAPAHQLASLIRRRKLSPVELVDIYLERIDRLNPRLNAYLTVCHDLARAAARDAEAAVMRGEELPPLHGVPVPIKDLNWTQGVRTTGGSLAYKDFVPDDDGAVVERLKQAGAIVIGKTNTSELGQSATTENRLGDDCRNPWDPACTSGGSSGGAGAAVAAGLAPLAQGSDGGGSIRIPAGFCGVYGIKPTQGRVPGGGSMGGMPLFSQSGPLSRAVRDAALLLAAIAGHDPRDPASLRETPPDFVAAFRRGKRSGPWRIAWSPDMGYAAVDPVVRQAAEAAARVFEGLGHKVEEATPPIDDPFAVFGPIILADEFAVSGHLLEEHAHELMPYVRAALERGQDIRAHEYSKALRGLERIRLQMAEFFDLYDLLLTPTLAVPAFPVGERPRLIAGVKVSALWGAFPFTMPFNLTGNPAASLPCGFSPAGLPIGLQVVGRCGEEATVLRASVAFEEARPWAARRPPVS